jgi:hypothetical protein
MKLDAEKLVKGLLDWELFWYQKRRKNRESVYQAALRRSKELKRPLVIIGAPDRGATKSPWEEAALVVDIGPSDVVPPKKFLQADICERLPIKDNSCVVYVACVLEYVGDGPAAMRELQRISGGHLFVVRVEPWTGTAYLYPGAKRTIPPIAPAPVWRLGLK